MKIALLLAVLAAACKPSKPMVAAEAPPVATEQNAAEKYVGAMQTDLKLAQDAKAKADAANKKMDDSQKAYKEAEAP